MESQTTKPDVELDKEIRSILRDAFRTYSTYGFRKMCKEYDPVHFVSAYEQLKKINIGVTKAYSFKNIVRALDMLGYDVKIVKRDTNENNN